MTTDTVIFSRGDVARGTQYRSLTRALPKTSSSACLSGRSGIKNKVFVNAWEETSEFHTVVISVMSGKSGCKLSDTTGMSQKRGSPLPA